MKISFPFSGLLLDIIHSMGQFGVLLSQWLESFENVLTVLSSVVTFFSQFHSFGSFINIFCLLGVYFYMMSDTDLLYMDPVFWIQCVEGTIFSPLYIFVIFVKNEVHGFIYWPSILFHPLTIFFVTLSCLYPTLAWQPGIRCDYLSTFVFKITCSTWRSLYFCMNITYFPLSVMF